MAFALPLDIAKRAIQELEQPTVTSWTDSSSRAIAEIAICYDDLRESELNRNLWGFAKKTVVLRAIGVDTLLWTPPTWSSGATYSVGSVVSYASTTLPYSGKTDYWQTDTAGTDSTTPDVATRWHRYCGPVAVDLYDSGLSYEPGEIVIVPAAWDSGTTYAKNAVVNGTGGNVGTWYVSLAASNLNNAVTDTTHWAVWASGGRTETGWGETADGVQVPLTYPGDTLFYMSLASLNTDNPTTSGSQWLSVNGTGVAFQPVYPVGAGPITQLQTKNVFYKPHAFMRQAPTDPKADATHYLGAPYNAFPQDWVMDGPFIVTTESGPLLVRFVANVVDVPDMHAMFCEGLALRIAEAVHPTVTQDSVKDNRAGQKYLRVMREARQVNAIENGPTAPVLGKYLQSRY